MGRTRTAARHGIDRSILGACGARLIHISSGLLCSGIRDARRRRRLGQGECIMRPPFTGVARRARPPWASRERRESTHHGRTGCGRESARDAQGCSGWRRGAQPERRAPWSSATRGQSETRFPPNAACLLHASRLGRREGAFRIGKGKIISWWCRRLPWAPAQCARELPTNLMIGS
jgi:hypothetical protein